LVVEQFERWRECPKATLVLELDVCQKLFATLDHPIVAANIGRSPPAGHIRAVVISSGACSLMHPPIIEMPPTSEGN
jgi:hypothetical protein